MRLAPSQTLIETWIHLIKKRWILFPLFFKIHRNLSLKRYVDSLPVILETALKKGLPQYKTGVRPFLLLFRYPLHHHFTNVIGKCNGILDG